MVDLLIKVEKFNSEEIFREFRKVQANTAKRQGFVPPSLKTLLAERQAFGDDIAIYVAKTSEDKPVKLAVMYGEPESGNAFYRLYAIAVEDYSEVETIESRNPFETEEMPF